MLIKPSNTVKYQLAEHIALTEVDDEVVLLDLNAGTYFGLNHVGARFLTALQANESYENVLSSIAHDYQMDQVAVSADLKALLQQLLEQKLIEEKR